MTQHEILQKYISGLCQDLGNALVVIGSAGIGKTETTLNTLNKLGLKENKEFIYSTNYSTPFEFFHLLEKVNKLNKPHLLILDDWEESLKHQRIIGLLRSALWETPNGERKVCWLSNRLKQKELFFEGKVIFLLNQFNDKSPIMQALKDRCLFYEMELSKKEILGLIREKAEAPAFNIPLKNRQEIAQFISQRSLYTPNLSLRIFPKICQLFRLSPNHWKLLAEKVI